MQCGQAVVSLFTHHIPHECWCPSISLHLSLSETEDWFVESLEKWRRAMGLQEFVLLGHSLGGYICSRYALKVRNI